MLTTMIMAAGGGALTGRGGALGGGVGGQGGVHEAARRAKEACRVQGRLDLVRRDARLVQPVPHTGIAEQHVAQ